MDRQLFKETFSTLHASPDTITEVLDMANGNRNRRNAARTGALLALAAVLLMGGAAAATAYRLRTEDFGELAVAVGYAEPEEAPGAVAFSDGAAAEFTGLDFEAGWLPEGMENCPGETVKWDYPEDDWRGGFSLGAEPLTAGDAVFCDVVPDAEVRESLEIGGREAFYVRQTGDVGFNQQLYISYPEYNAVVLLYIGANMDRDTAVEFAEHLKVSAGSLHLDPETLEYTGRRYRDMANYIATGVYENTADEDAAPQDFALEDLENRGAARAAAAEDMAKAKALGESFSVREMDFRGESVEDVDVTVKVTEVQFAEDISILRDPSRLDSGVARLLEEDGRIPADTLRYYVLGDGVTTPGSTVVAEEPQQPQLVAVTVDFTNDTEDTIRDIVFRGQLMAVAETEMGWEEYLPTPSNGADYDVFGGQSGETLTEMRCFDVHDPVSNGGNHILDLAPGETVTVQMAFLVNECQAEHLWFFLDSGSQGAPEGYVALRP